ncbi:MAG: hypothetical protein AAFZ89_13995 [Bacteroidota bacterium]
MKDAKLVSNNSTALKNESPQREKYASLKNWVGWAGGYRMVKNPY